MANALGFLYLLAAAELSVYGCLGLLTLWLYWQHRHDVFPCPEVPSARLPAVTIQLPLYNERYVVERLIRAAVNLDYPTDRLQIQVIDDSTDDTTQKAAVLVNHYRQKGIDIALLHRPHRRGYKAGALAYALNQVKGEYVAVFDADFQPPPDFLRRTIPHFLFDDRLGMVQARWGHLNHDCSAFTAAQAIALDKHFVMEQTVRHRANLFPKFNGTAGVWRRGCLESTGGWEDDTVCEDLCLSTRAVLQGWQFLFLNEVVAPAELPTSMNAYKNQQARWAKGSIQCLLKFGRSILADSQHSWLARLYALLSMSAYATHGLLLILLLLQIPLLLLDYQLPSYTFLFSLVGLGQPLLFILAQQVLYPDWKQRLRSLPTMLFLVIGIAPSNSRAIWQALFGRGHAFIRTPKGSVASSFTTLGTNGRANGYVKNQFRYRPSFDWIILVELFLALYAGAGLLLALWQGHLSALFLLTACTLGFGYVSWLSFYETKIPDP